MFYKRRKKPGLPKESGTKTEGEVDKSIQPPLQPPIQPPQNQLYPSFNSMNTNQIQPTQFNNMQMYPHLPPINVQVDKQTELEIESENSNPFMNKQKEK